MRATEIVLVGIDSCYKSSVFKPPKMFGFDLHICWDATGNLRFFENVATEDKYALANQRYFGSPVRLEFFEDDDKA